MLNASLDMRQNAWKFQHAEVCMGLLLDICDRVKPLCDGRQPEDTATFYASITSMYVLYGRPFKQQAPFRLSKDIVPSEHMGLHENMISFRDKIFAHLDSGSNAVVDDGGDPVAKMVLIKTPTALQCTMSCIVPRQQGVEDILNLAIIVRKKCQENLQIIWKPYPGLFEMLTNGLYEINVQEPGDAPILRKMI